MTESKNAIAPRSVEVGEFVDPDDAPELTEEWFAKADLHVAGKLVRRGRPKSAAPKEQVTLRIDADVLKHFKAAGPGWQSRMNASLRMAAAGSNPGSRLKKR